MVYVRVGDHVTVTVAPLKGVEGDVIETYGNNPNSGVTLRVGDPGDTTEITVLASEIEVLESA